jgi:DNA polymerase/3'-5' exonuclease PolX
MTNRHIAAMLFNIATLLDMTQDNIYRVRAYHRAARRILALREEATAIVARGDDLPLPGVGDHIRRRLAEVITTGSLSYYQDLLEDLLPTSVRSLMVVEGMGPKTAQRLCRELGISSPEDLVHAAEKGRVRTLYGFGIQKEADLARAAREAVAADRRVA